MLQLCVDARLFYASGIGTLLRALLPRLSEEFSLCLLKKKEEKIPLDVEQISLESAIYTLQEQRELCQKIPKVDVFWSPHYNIPLRPLRARKRLVTLHDLYPLAFSSRFRMREKFYAKLMFTVAPRLADHLTTVSEFSKQEIQKYCHFRGPITVIPNFVPPAFLQPYEEKERKHLLAVGNLKPHKNLLRLVQAFDRLPREEILLLVGKSEGLRNVDQELLSYLSKSSLRGRVFYLGELPEEELIELYKSAKLLLFPSYYEGFGLPPLEAMALGCPVLAARAASIPEVCGPAAHYVDPYNIDSIYEGMKTVLQNEALRLDLISRGKKRVSEYSLEKSAKQYSEIIRNL